MVGILIHRRNARRIQHIHRVTPRVTRIRDAQGLAVLDLLGRDIRLVAQRGGQHVRRLDQRRYQTHLHVPLDVAVVKPYSGVISPEADHGVRQAVDGVGVPARRVRVVHGFRWAGPDACAGGRFYEDLKLVAVHVERVGGRVAVHVDYEIDDLVLLDDHGVHVAVHGAVEVVAARGDGGEEGGHFGRHVWAWVALVVVETSSEKKMIRGENY